jgi:protein phosphatase PTC6
VSTLLIVVAFVLLTFLSPRSHGGSAVAQYLRQELHGLFESVDKSNIPELYAYMKEIGGYFKRFNGGALAPWIKGEPSTPLDLEARATQAFLEVVKHACLLRYSILIYF